MGALIGCLLVCFVYVVVPGPAAAAQGGALTVRSRVAIGAAAEGLYWLGGFASLDGGAPDVLGLVWAEVSAGWFGSVWGLHLVSAAGVLPPRLGTAGSGALSGYSYYTLFNIDPRPGHAYEAALSYDPETGAVAVRVDDVTAGATVLERGLTVGTWPGGLYPGAAAGGGGSESWEAVPGFVPYGLTWRLVQVQDDGTLLQAQPVDRRRPVDLYVRVPWDGLPGTLRLWLEEDLEGRTDRKLLAAAERVASEAFVRTALAEQPAGTYRVHLEYEDRGIRHGLGGQDVQVGVVDARPEGVRITLAGPRELRIEGELAVAADGPLTKVTVGVDVGLERVVLVPAAEPGSYRFGTEHERTVPAVRHEFAALDRTERRISFAATLPLGAVAWPYRKFTVRVVPQVPAGAAGRAVTAYEETVRVYAEEQPGRTLPLRVMTFNIRHGEGTDGMINLERIADVIAYAGADIVGLQEVDVGTRRSGGVNQVAALAQMLGMNAAFGANLAYQGGEYGNALLTRLPIVSSRNVRLVRTSGETRGLLHAVIDVDGTPLNFFVTHLSYVQDENARQRLQITDILRQTSGPFVLVGDLNIAWDRTSPPLFEDAAKDAWLEAVSQTEPGSPLRSPSSGGTFTSARPDRRIDYIFLSEDVAVARADGVYTIRTDASDHLPVVAELALPAAAD